MEPLPTPADPFVERVGRFLDEEIALPRSACVLVGVSGGPDSLALLEALRRLAAGPERAYRLAVAHLNHLLRPDAAADAAFVEGLARCLGLPCAIESRDVRALAAARGMGLEQAAREARYAFLASAAARAGAAYVAVGHHADDNVETVLYRIARGTHLRGLAGMPARRMLPGGAVLVRPLLGCTRRETEDFCRRAALEPRADASNADQRLRRNFIRLSLLPLLRERLNARVDEAVLRLAGAAGRIEALLADLARRALDRCRLDSPKGEIALSRSALAGENEVLQAYVLREALERIGVPMRDVGADRLDELRGLFSAAGPSALVLPGGFLVRREEDRIVVGPAPAPEAPAPAPEPLALADWAVEIACPGRTTLPDGAEIACELSPLDAAAFEAHRRARPPGVEWLDADQVRGPILCRPRRTGDAFVPLGAPGRRSVGDFLTDLKLPRPRRDAVRCLCDTLGLVYLAPLRIDDRVKVTPATRRILRIEFRPSPPQPANPGR